jgi:hypothetical protein
MPRLRSTTFLVATAVLLPGGAAAASDFCVGVAGCDQQFAQIQPALDAAKAAPGHDRVLIGDGVFTENVSASDDVTIQGSGTGTVISGLALAQGASAEDVQVDGGAIVGAGGGTIDGATLAGAPALRVLSGGSAVTVRRTRLIGRGGPGVVAAESGSLTIRDSLVDARATGSGSGITTATITPGARHDVSLASVTVLGHGDDALAPGIDARAAEAGDSVTVDVRDSVVAGFGAHALARGGAGVANLSVDYADVFPPSQPAQRGIGTLTVGTLLQADPRFAGDGITPAAGSPLIDAATPGAFGIGELDLAGNPRLAAYGCGVPRRDIGAIETVGGCTATPTVDAAPRVSRLHVVGRRTLRFDLTETAHVTAQVVRAYRRPLVLHRAAAAGTVTLRLAHRLRHGRYAIRVIAVDAAGHRSSAARVRESI